MDVVYVINEISGISFGAFNGFPDPLNPILDTKIMILSAVLTEL